MIDLHTEIKNILSGKTMIAETATKLVQEPAVVDGALKDGFKRIHLANFLTEALCRMIDKAAVGFALSESELRQQLQMKLDEVMSDFIRYHRDFTPKVAQLKHMHMLEAQIHSLQSEMESMAETLTEPEEEEEKTKDRQAFEKMNQKTATCKLCGKEGVLKVRLQAGFYYEVAVHGKIPHRQRQLTREEAVRLAREYGTGRKSSLDTKKKKAEQGTWVLESKPLKCETCNEEGYKVLFSEKKDGGRRYYIAMNHPKKGLVHRQDILTKEEYEKRTADAKPVPHGHAAAKFWRELK